MFKLNFEKSAVFVLILILCVSTVNIYSQYFSTLFSRKSNNVVQTSVSKDISFLAMILKADQYYQQNKYKEAQGEYLKLASNPNLSLQQKATVNFKLGVSNYKLGQYELARDSFLKAAEYSTNDPAVYNNAAAASFYMGELEMAEELQKKAVEILPVIEYHYNLARIYEASGRYGDSVKYYAAVVRGEENITRGDRIDPVRIKNKVMKLSTDMRDIEKITNELMIALKLKDAREVFIIEDAGMDIKDKNFKWRIDDSNGIKRLYCSYDREKSDPYNLIDSLKWTVRSNGKTIYTGKRDEFSLNIDERNDYIVYLDIYYDNNKQMSSSANVTKGSGMYSNSGRPTTNPSNAKCKYYEFATYEQVFEKDFRISRSGYIDRFNTRWGKDNVETTVMDKDFIDAQSALYIKNSSDRAAGIWADLSALINDKQLKGKTIGIKFYARKISANADLHLNISIKSGRIYKNVPREYEMSDDYKWKRFGVDVSIPDNADGLTVSFKTPAGEEVKIDGFIITIVR